jgi:hypothetical protein
MSIDNNLISLDFRINRWIKTRLKVAISFEINSKIYIQHLIILFDTSGKNKLLA